MSYTNTEFPVNSYRFDPYKNSHFHVIWDGRVVAGVYSVSPLTRTTTAVPARDAADSSAPRLGPGLTTYAPIALQRARTHDNAFEQWANLVWEYGSAGTPDLRHFRKDILVELQNEAGQTNFAYKVHRCWVSEYQAIPQLDSLGNAILGTLVLQNEGWERDNSVQEPVQPVAPKP